VDHFSGGAKRSPAIGFDVSSSGAIISITHRTDDPQWIDRWYTKLTTEPKLRLAASMSIISPKKG
jgi:hypothetical protein